MKYLSKSLNLPFFCAECLDGWVQFGDNCYLAFTHASTWEVAFFQVWLEFDYGLFYILEDHSISSSWFSMYILSAEKKYLDKSINQSINK